MIKKENIRIETHDVTYSIDDLDILRGISMQVANGQMVGIVGPNGSGKTTFLKHIYRALPTKKQTVFVNGQAIEELSFGQSAREMTVVKQENSSAFDFTVENMVLLGRSPYHNSFESFSQEDRQIAYKALESIGMTDYANRFFNELSGGEKQRVLIARSLTQQADIFLLDEPTNHLDVYYQWSLMELIHSLKATVLGVFHELNLAAYYCDVIYVMKAGKIVCYGTPVQVLTRENLANIFRVDAEVIMSSKGVPHIIFNGAMTM